MGYLSNVLMSQNLKNPLSQLKAKRHQFVRSLRKPIYMYLMLLKIKKCISLNFPSWAAMPASLSNLKVF